MSFTNREQKVIELVNLTYFRTKKTGDSSIDNYLNTIRDLHRFWIRISKYQTKQHVDFVRYLKHHHPVWVAYNPDIGIPSGPPDDGSFLELISMMLTDYALLWAIDVSDVDAWISSHH